MDYCYCKHAEFALNKIGEPGEIDREIVELFIQNAGVNIYVDCDQSHKFALECWNEKIEEGDIPLQIADYYGVDLSDAITSIETFMDYFKNISSVD